MWGNAASDGKGNSVVITKIFTSVSAVLIFVMTAAIFTQVLTRYVLHISIPWLQFVIKFSMSWLTMLGSAVALEKRGHFAINIFSDSQTNVFTKTVSVLRECIVMTTILALIYSGFKFAMLGINKEDPSSGLSEIYTYSSVLIGAIAMLYYFAKTTLTENGKVKNVP